MQIWLKRAYEKPGPQDGQRILVDRVWPRGVRKEDLRLDAWLKEAAPSTALRKWFGHDPDKWEEFVRRYERELDEGGGLARIGELARRGRLTLVYGARDTEHNNAAALRRILRERTGNG